MGRKIRPSQTAHRAGPCTGAYAAHPHRAGQEARTPGTQPTHTAQQPGHQQAGQPRHQGHCTQDKRESAAATHAAHARHSGQGSEARRRPCIR